MSDLEEHKLRILSHARERFLKEGFAKISIDELTSDLSMSKKTFYRVFESKDQVIEELLNLQMVEINTQMDATLAKQVDAVTKLHELIGLLGAKVGSISKTAMLDLQRHFPHLWNRVQQFRRERMTRNISHVVQQGVQEGSLRKDINPRILLLAYLAAIETIVQPAVLANESFSSKEAIIAIMDIFFKGVLTDGGRLQLRDLEHNQSNFSI